MLAIESHSDQWVGAPSGLAVRWRCMWLPILRGCLEHWHVLLRALSDAIIVSYHGSLMINTHLILLADSRMVGIKLLATYVYCVQRRKGYGLRKAKATTRASDVEYEYETKTLKWRNVVPMEVSKSRHRDIADCFETFHGLSNVRELAQTNKPELPPSTIYRFLGQHGISCLAYLARRTAPRCSHRRKHSPGVTRLQPTQSPPHCLLG